MHQQANLSIFSQIVVVHALSLFLSCTNNQLLFPGFPCRGQIITLPAQPQGTVSYSFLLLSGNTSFSHTSRHLILTKLGHSDRYLNHYSRTNNDGVRGHDGVTGVKKVIFTKKASSPTECVALTRDFCICICLTPSTKVITLKHCPGSFGVTGVKRSFSLKIL